VNWDIFECVQQEGLTVNQTALKLDISPTDVVRAMKYMKRKHPELFCIETEKANIAGQLPSDGRPEMLSYNALMDSRVEVKF
jgi:hypothetical protein